MRFPDRPVSTAILGVIFGLILLGVLSSPGLVPGLGSSSSTQYQQPTTSEASTEINSSSTPRANNSLGIPLTETSVETKTSQVSTSITTEIFLSTTTSTQSSSQNTSQVSSIESHSLQSSVSPTANLVGFNSLITLSVVALAIALGSMLFVHRRVYKDGSES